MTGVSSSRKIGVAAEDAMLFAEVAVEPEIGLILIVGLGGGADEIVGAGDVRQRIVLQNLEPRWDRSGSPGMVLFGNCVRGEVAGSKIGCVKMPCRCASVGTTLNRVMPVRSRVPCQSAKKNVLLRLNRSAERQRRTDCGGIPVSGPAARTGCAHSALHCGRIRTALPWNSLLPDFPITMTVPPLDRPYSGE